MNIENSDSFGNYLVHGIDEIMLPETVAWWPQAPGWRVLGGVVALWLLWLCVKLARRWWRNRYRREALRQLSRLQRGDDSRALLAALPFYLKATALQAYPRDEVASLSGDQWLEFLDAHYPGPAFVGENGASLLAISYLPEDRWQLETSQHATLVEMTRLWIAKHHEAAHV